MSQQFIDGCKQLDIEILINVALAPLCSFKSGGCAEMFCTPQSNFTLKKILQLATKYNIAITILGGGSNVLAPDTRLSGLTISTTKLNNITLHEDYAIIESGISIRKAASQLANNGKRALDFLYGMPGSMGGALWMNARCYGHEISEVLIKTSGLTLQGEVWNYDFNPDDFSYKTSPFQHKMGIITDCYIRTHNDAVNLIWSDMIAHEMDRTHKGHYLAPCAGSIFKNNYDFGAPTGKLLDQLGWRNQSYKDAMVNPYHANIIINKGHALSQDIYDLSLRMKQSIQKSYNIELEHEIILLGNEELWQKQDKI